MDRDFIGFEFGGVHSETLGITRVSGGDRYDENLHPEIKDINAEVPGVDGNYYFGSNFGTKTIDIDIAFDSLTEEQFRQLRTVFRTRDIKKLVFDERPYKYYMAKLADPIELSYVCFEEQNRHPGPAQDGIRVIGHNATRELLSSDEYVVVPASGHTTYTLTYAPIDTVSLIGLGDWIEYIQDGTTFAFTNTTNVDRMVSFSYRYEQRGLPEYEQVTPWIYDEGTRRVYKGEGKISFICYFPFAKSNFKTLPKSTDDYYEGSEDWAFSSGLLTQEEYEAINQYNSETGQITVYNPGDLETGFRLYLPAAACATATTISYKKIREGSTINAQLILDAITLKSGDVGVLIDTNTQLIIGVSDFAIEQSGDGIYTTSGNLYNQYVNAGTFFHLEPNSPHIYSTVEITDGSAGIYIFYDYLYF